VVLTTTDQAMVLPIFVDEPSAIAIALRLLHHPSPLLLTQDLLDSMLTQLGGTLTEVRIDQEEEESFTSQVLISQGKKKMQLEARAADSISMALAHGAKIFTSRQVLERAGVSKRELDELGKSELGTGGSGEGDQNIKL
jgi:bifunctional DNase/RNase